VTTNWDQRPPHPNPLPEGEGTLADRFHTFDRLVVKRPLKDSLSPWERVRVRALSFSGVE
jgi:hypothetical protein